MRRVRRSTRSFSSIGYAPDPQARGLAFRRSFLIGLVYDNPNAQYIVNIQDGALDALRGSGFELVVHPCDRFSEDFMPGVRRFVERQKLHGVILLPPVSEDEALARALQEIDCQCVRLASVRLDQHVQDDCLERSRGDCGSGQLSGSSGPSAHRVHRGPQSESLRARAA